MMHASNRVLPILFSLVKAHEGAWRRFRTLASAYLRERLLATSSQHPAAWPRCGTIIALILTLTQAEQVPDGTIRPGLIWSSVLAGQPRYSLFCHRFSGRYSDRHIGLEAAAAIIALPQVKCATGVSGDSYKTFRIVGTTPTILQRPFMPRACNRGAFMGEAAGSAVVGAEAAGNPTARRPVVRWAMSRLRQPLSDQTGKRKRLILIQTRLSAYWAITGTVD
jgi:hypothetical protein